MDAHPLISIYLLFDVWHIFLGSQNLMGVMINFDDLTVVQRCPVPIQKKQILKWLGVTEEGVCWRVPFLAAPS
jgi:hypothetical protein